MIRIVRGGELDEDLLRLIAHNTRDPEERALDLKVQIATNERGARLTQRAGRQMGLAAVATRDRRPARLHAPAAAQPRSRAWPDGESSFTTYLDDDGLGGDPVPIRATVIVSRRDGWRSISPAPARKREVR